MLNNLNTKSSEIFVAGDFNINLLELNTKEKVNVFFNDVTSFGFKPSITLPTRLGDYKGTLVDNILCKVSNPSQILSSGITLSKFSDHQHYFTSLDFRLPIIKNKPIKFIRVCKIRSTKLPEKNICPQNSRNFKNTNIKIIRNKK